MINLDKLKEKIVKHFKMLSDSDRNNKKILIIRTIFKELKKGYKEKNGKIVLDLQLWVNLHGKELFKKNSMLIHNLTKELKKKRFVSSDYALYPKNNTILSVNPLSKSFLRIDLNTYDKSLYIKDILKEKLNYSALSLEIETYIYIYLRLFSLPRIPNEYYKYLNRSNLYRFDDKVGIIFTLDNYKGFMPIRTIFLDDYISSLFIEIFFNENKSILRTTDHIFTKNLSFYDRRLNKFCKENNILIQQFHMAHELNYQLHNSPLKLTLKKFARHPKISLFELDHLYPNTINKKLLEIEKNNMNIYRNSNFIADDNEIDLDDYLSANIELYDKFKRVRQVPNSKGMIKYLNYWYAFISNQKGAKDIYLKMFNHVLFLLEKADKRIKTNPITPKTLSGYLQVLFQYCFTYFIMFDDSQNALAKIFDNLQNNEQLVIKTKRNYRRVINHFLLKTGEKEFARIQTTINYNRSIVFERELDKLLDKLKYRDKEYKHPLLKTRRMVYVILLYYTGLRKNELLSRLIRDFYFISDREFVIDVNKKGINKINKYNKNDDIGLKNRNAKRRVSFTIDNTKHFNIVKKYLDLIDEIGCTFVFPGRNKNTIFKKRVMKVQPVNEISGLLQDVTKRYTPLHSFRHSYATNEIGKIINKQDSSIYDVFDLTIKMGHGEFETTLINYAHLYLYMLARI